MKEASFIKQNRDKWKAFEEMMKQKGTVSPDKLSDLFIRLTDDLAYARTYYPKSRTTSYLNSLAASVHLSIYRNRRERKGRFASFWKQEVPMISFLERKPLFYALLFFTTFSIIGAVSAAFDPEFVRLILGDAYVNMTLENIKEGKPMGVYDSMGQVEMFFAITVNNIRVSFMVFAAGAFFSVGTVIMLLYNGIMLGAFQYFFHEQGLLGHAASTIWIHGTLEIAAIVIAGGAGVAMGNSFLFPKTYPRLHSFKHGAKRGIKIIISLIPVFMTAGFLESFVTRYEYMPLVLKLAIIIPSSIYIIYYYAVLPNKLGKNQPAD